MLNISRSDCIALFSVKINTPQTCLNEDSVIKCFCLAGRLLHISTTLLPMMTAIHNQLISKIMSFIIRKVEENGIIRVSESKGLLDVCNQTFTNLLLKLPLQTRLLTFFIFIGTFITSML